MTAIFSVEFPMVHQITLSSRPEFEVMTKNNQIIRSLVGVDNYKLWNSESILNFLDQHYPKSVITAYNLLKPFALKADLARYCLLNYFGGLYLDMSVQKLQPFRAEYFDMVVFRDLNSDRTSWKVANNFFFSKPNSLVLHDSISECLKNIGNRHYGSDAHCPTGPVVLGRSVAKFGESMNLLVGQYYWHRYRKNKYILPGWGVVARHKRGGSYSGGSSGVEGGNNYNEMWKLNDLYCN